MALEPALSAPAHVSLLLASQSPARLATLRAAGISPLVRVSGVDEDAVLARAQADADGSLAPHEAVLALARAKAEAVAAVAEHDADLLLACDSMLEIDGAVVGKPHDPAVATHRWRTMRGRSGVLHTGHWLLDTRPAAEDGTGRSLGATASTTVRFADLTDEEIDAYVATGEPLSVAGGFTVDGLGGAFVTATDGDYHNVVGLSLPLLRTLVAELGVAWPRLWDASVRRPAR